MDVSRCIITGSSGSGKTSLCQAAAEQARKLGWQVAGLLSPARLAGGKKTGIDAVDLRSGEKRLLACVQRQSESDLGFGNWFFDRGALEWGNQVLLAADPCDLLIIDELGPLEFDLSMGFTRSFEIIARGSYRGALIVVRPHLVQRAEQLFQPQEVIRIDSVSAVQPQLKRLVELWRKYRLLP